MENKKEVLGLDKEMCANIFFNPKFLIDEENKLVQ